jgi:hypothetical protein
MECKARGLIQRTGSNNKIPVQINNYSFEKVINFTLGSILNENKYNLKLLKEYEKEIEPTTQMQTFKNQNC